MFNFAEELEVPQRFHQKSAAKLKQNIETTKRFQQTDNK
jgi:hypothetical protein